MPGEAFRGVPAVLKCTGEDSGMYQGRFRDVAGRIPGCPGSAGMSWDVPGRISGCTGEDVLGCPGSDGNPRPLSGGGAAEPQHPPMANPDLRSGKGSERERDRAGDARILVPQPESRELSGRTSKAGIGEEG